MVLFDLFFFGYGFPYKVTNLKKGALIVVWVLGYQGAGHTSRFRAACGALQPAGDWVAWDFLDESHGCSGFRVQGLGFRARV